MRGGATAPRNRKKGKFKTKKESEDFREKDVKNDPRSKDLEPISSSVSSKSERHPVGTSSGTPRKTSAIVLHFLESVNG